MMNCLAGLADDVSIILPMSAVCLFWHVVWILKGKNLVGFSHDFIQVVHPADGACAAAHKTVGLHAHPSDIEIPFEPVDFPADREGFIPKGFEDDTLAQHEDADVVAFAYSGVGQAHGIVDRFSVIGGDDEKNVHRLSPLFQDLAIKITLTMQVWLPYGLVEEPDTEED
jgi:hypothetical protein